MIRFFLITTLFTILSSFAFAQQKPMKAHEAIGLLEKGTLVFRLSTNSRKIAALEMRLANVAKEKDRERSEKLLEETRLNTRTENLGLISAFRNHYDFSKVLFLPDTAISAFKAGVRQGIFVNDSLELDTSIVLDGDYLVAYYGISTSDQTTANEGITVLDPNLVQLESPFPFFTGRTSARRMFQEEFKKMTDQDHFNILVGKFQRQLKEF